MNATEKLAAAVLPPAVKITTPQSMGWPAFPTTAKVPFLDPVTGLPPKTPMGVAHFSAAVCGALLANSKTINRTMRRVNLAILKAEMASRGFKVTGETVIFDMMLNVLNGHHRLTSGFESGAGFDSCYVWGVDPAMFKYMDKGSPRSASDLLGVAGFTNVTTLSNAALAVWQSERGRTGYYGLSMKQYGYNNEDVLEVMDRHPKLPEATAAGLERYRRNRIVPPGLWAFLEYTLGGVLPDVWAGFAEALITGYSDPTRGYGPKNPDPALVLRDKLGSRPGREEGGKAAAKTTWLNREVVMAFIIQAWQRYVAYPKPAPNNLRYTPGKDKFPRLDPAPAWYSYDLKRDDEEAEAEPEPHLFVMDTDPEPAAAG